MLWNRSNRKAINYFQSIFLFFLASCSLFSLEGDVKEQIGTGIGYKNNYTTISLYHPFEQGSWAPFIDGRLLFFHRGRVGFNVGGGTQYLFSEQDALGGYGYVDFRKGPDHYSFWQLTPGLSYVHRFVTSQNDYGALQIFANGYFPVRWRNKDVSAPLFNRFEGNHLFINRTDRIALTGMNVEVGYRTPSFHNLSLYLGGSPYYFKKGKVNTKLGGLGKLSFSYKELISIEGMITHDSVFGTRLNAIFKLSIPLSKKGMEEARKGVYRSKTSYPPKRFEQIVLAKTEEKITARDIQGNPLTFFFVDNLSNSLGTFESPFPTLVQAEQAANEGNFIYVFPGDGMTTGMDQGIILQPRQTLAGAATPLPVTTQLGTVTIPPFSAVKPTLTNSGGSGVLIDHLCYVSGIRAYGASGNGFESVDRAALTAALESCEALNNNGDAGFYFNAGSSDNKITLTLSNCLAIENGLPGAGYALVTGGSSSAAITYSNCHAIDNDFDGYALLTGDSSSAVVTYFNCQSSENGNAGYLLGPRDSSSAVATYFNCQSSENGGVGYLLGALNSAHGVVTYSKCQSSENVGAGFLLGALNSSNATVTYSDCIASGNGTDGFPVQYGPSVECSLNYFNCLSQSNSGKGFVITNLGGVLQGSFSYTNCQANNNGVADFDFSVLSPNSSFAFNGCNFETVTPFTAAVGGATDLQLIDCTFPPFTVDGQSLTDMQLEGHTAPSITLTDLDVQAPSPPSLSTLQQINPNTTVIDGGGVTFVSQ